VGVAVGVYDRGRRDVFGFGRVAAGGPPPDATTVFEIGSITKTYTAAVLAAVVREGLASLDQPARELLPPGARVPSYQGRDFTLLELADHTSGLPRLPDNLETTPGFVPDDPYAHYGDQALADFLARYPLPRAPGSKHEYSNLGYGLLGHILARRLGTTYAEAVRSRVAVPLGLGDTRIELGTSQLSRLATGHDGQGRPVPLWRFDALEGAGALRSTVADQLSYAAAVLGHGPSPVTADLAACLVPRFAPPATSYEVGLAWFRQPLGTTPFTVVHHDGGTGGFSSYLGVVPERDLGVVVLANTDREVVTPGQQILEWLVTR
jgi:CubicO group peptidase (beta-lactamase class C family)